ncbi:MAG: DUF1540 domain-containing protein [Clostridia bacterium]|nr:DUF1540 domain-containing protein [Clostridia bacterium]
MAELKCDAKNCVYNRDRSCSKGDIMVGGKSAHTSRETCCDSFRNDTGDHFKSSLEHPSQVVSIDCEAEKCEYNSGYRCHAKHVEITGCTACDCKETICSTFKKQV